MSKSLKRVAATLEAAGLETSIVELVEGTRTAAAAAAAAGCHLDQIAKSIIFRGVESGCVLLFITAGGNQVDPAKASTVAGETLDKADAALIRAQTGFAIGGVAPVGHVHPVRAFWDRRLDDFDRVWAAAGTPRHIFAAAPAEIRQLSGAEAADFTN